MRYSAFISYNHRDRKSAHWLHRALETYRFPRHLIRYDSAIGPIERRLPPVFQDREELAARSDLAAAVRDALAEAHSLIVVCSPAGAASHWVNEEIRAFSALGRRDRIQCLIVSGVPNASRGVGDDPSLECLPPALFETGDEPLASDIRPGQDGKLSAKLKLIAGILDIPYDELRRREHARRQKRLLMIAIAASIGFFVMAALTVFALVSRAEAIRQRDIAREKTATAERTVDFVKSLFEVSDPSEARGAKVTALEVLDKGANRIRQSLDDEPNVKADLMTTLGQVYLGLGSYRRGDAILSEAMHLSVSDARVRARQLMGVASSADKQGDHLRAAKLYRQALTIVDADPELRADFRPALLAAIGDALAGAGRLSEGVAGMMEALKTDRAHKGPRSVEVARDLEALGGHYSMAEDYPRARALFEQAVSIRVARQGLSHPQVSENYNELGSIAYFQGDVPAAERYLRRALKSDMLVLGADHPDVAITMNNVARVMLEQREFAGARDFLTRAIDVTLRNRNNMNAYLALLYANLGLAQRSLGQRDDATLSLTKALRVAQATKHRNLGPILTELADLSCADGDPARGLAMLDQAMPVTLADYPDDPWRKAWVLNTRGRCLVAAGQVVAGRAMLADSFPALRERWQRGSLYRVIAEQRRAGAGA